MLTCRLPYKIYNRCSQFFRLEFCSNIIFYQYLSHFTNKILYLFLSFSFHFCPSSVTLLSQKKKKPQGCVLVGVTSTGLEISEVLNGEQQSVCNLPWPSIHSITFQGRKFDIRAEGLHEKKLVLYSLSVLHAKNLLQHISNSHRLHLSTKPLVMLKEKNGRHREMYITDGADLDMEDSDDELPPMKFLLDNVQKQTTGTTPCRTVTGSDASNGSCGLEMSVDEPEEMFVDDPEDVLRLIELVEGVSVDGPLFLPISHWKGETNQIS
ncbi:uncharacterized protein LOC109104478 isoform X1 [Cyprinus carpio]|uniref:Uncharacterized protein LOC109104478 isoform X1 n=1 Tax=Cyprinus carpio TaxID=7962 RepID=A0A9Q9WY42_CYPCA|nr:uncharacterized protein LOC109104478 isoform X1 [Cyprinus carpio]